MTIELDHTIVAASDREATARFLSDVLGLDPPTTVGRFRVVALANGVNLDVALTQATIEPQHYAFSVSESEFDEIFARIHARGLDYWADPARRRRGEIDQRDGGRGVYFPAPDGHVLEILTRS